MNMEDNIDLAAWPQQAKKKPDEAYDELHVLLNSLTNRVETLERRIDEIDTGFVRDDLGKPGYAGHRAAHLEQIDTAKTLSTLKQSGAKRLVDMALSFLGGILLLGAVAWFKNPK